LKFADEKGRFFRVEFDEFGLTVVDTDLGEVHVHDFAAFEVAVVEVDHAEAFFCDRGEELVLGYFIVFSI